MNIKGFKKICREFDKNINITLYSEKLDLIWSGSFEEFYNKTDYDKRAFVTWSCFLNENLYYTSKQMLIDNFSFNIIVSDFSSNNNNISISVFNKSKNTENGKIFNCNMSEELKYDLIKIYSCSREKQLEVQEKYNKYITLPVDFIELNFNPDELWEVIQNMNKSEQLSETEEYHNSLSVYVYPLIQDDIEKITYMVKEEMNDEY